MAVSPPRIVWFTRTPNWPSLPKRRPMSTCVPNEPDTAPSTVTRVSGLSSARLSCRFTPPPIAEPFGDAPFRNAFAPLNTSTRSTASISTSCRGVTPYRPFSDTSSPASWKPRMTNTCEKLPYPDALRTAGSLSSTSASVRACWFSISFDV